MRWSLYIDESGEFDSEGRKASIVAGVLIPVGRLKSGTAFRTALERIVPGRPWPIHAWLLFRPSMYALWAAAAKEPVEPRLLECADALRDPEPEAFESALKALRDGDEPRCEDLDALDGTVDRLSPDLRGFLMGSKRGAWSCVGAVLRNVRAILVEEQARLFYAGETRTGDAIPAADDPLDRYLHVLAALLERAAHSLATEPAGEQEHVVDVRPLGRHVHWWNDRIGRRWMPMHSRHLMAAAQHAVAANPPVFRWNGVAVRLNAGNVAEWGPCVFPHHVLADLAANRARPMLAERWTLTRLRARLGGAGLLTAAGLPPVAATGEARAILAGALRGEPLPTNPGSAPPPPRRWAIEASLDWAGFFHVTGEVRP